MTYPTEEEFKAAQDVVKVWNEQQWERQRAQESARQAEWDSEHVGRLHRVGLVVEHYGDRLHISFVARLVSVVHQHGMLEVMVWDNGVTTEGDIGLEKHDILAEPET